MTQVSLSSPHFNFWSQNSHNQLYGSSHLLSDIRASLSNMYVLGQWPSLTPWPLPMRISPSKLSYSIGLQLCLLVHQSSSIEFASFPRFGYLLPRPKFVTAAFFLLGISTSEWPESISYQLCSVSSNRFQPALLLTYIKCFQYTNVLALQRKWQTWNGSLT